MKWLFPLFGLLSLFWFLARVIPKPSRATYPCQRVAFPLALSFVVWLIGAIGSMVAFRKAKYYIVRSHYVVGVICIALGIGGSLIAISGGDERRALADDPIPNDPIGISQGIHPGRVVWVHDPNATDWDGPGMGDGHWWESGNTDMAVVDQMMSRAICELVGESGSTEAWDKIFRHFNHTHGKGDVGYQVGEKITIKVNLVGCIGVSGWGGVDPNTYELVDNMDYMNTSPQMMLALLRELVYKVGVNQADIAVGDTLCYFPNQYYDLLHDEFPDVRYLDYEGKFGRTGVQQSSLPLYWSSHPSVSSQDYVPVSYAEADYIINMANFKSHSSAAVTFCGKNHYGSLVRWPAQAGYYNLHNDLPSNRDGMGYYRPLVDLMGHAHIGGKTLLYLIDGLYAGHHPYDDAPTKLNSTPFNGDWSSSLFVSQDPVAIDSVAFDFLWAESGWSADTHMAGGDDYLHEAAQADNPPSRTFYDPDHSGDVTRLTSLGVHEHWNNPSDKQYSRNLGTGDGIELISLSPGMDGYLQLHAEWVKCKITGLGRSGDYTVNGTLAIENRGNETSLPGTLTVYVSEDEEHDGDLAIKEVSVPPIRPGKGRRKGFASKVPLLTNIRYLYFIATLQAGGDEYEPATMMLDGGVDLAGEWVSPPSVTGPDRRGSYKIRGKCAVLNIGFIAAGTFEAQVYYSENDEFNPADDTPILKKPKRIPKLLPGKKKTVNFNWKTDEVPIGGTFFLVVDIPDTGVIDELDEGNNVIPNP